MEELIEAARRVRERAYCPYSNYQVGAALEDEHGRVSSGCNVENVSFGATICAERTAITRLVAEGGRQWKRLALVTRDGGTPCGICLQVLLEFAAPEAEVLVLDASGQQRLFKFTELLPYGFASEEVVGPQKP